MGGMDPNPGQERSVEAPERQGREWLVPGLLLAGALALARIEILERLAVEQRGVDPGWAAWAVLRDWPAQLVQGLVIGCVAAAVLFGTEGPRRAVGSLFAAALFFSLLSGWPVAPPEELALSGAGELPDPWLLGALCLLLSGALTSAAWFVGGLPRLARLLDGPPAVGQAQVLGQGLPANQLLQREGAAPLLPEVAAGATRTRAAREAPSLLLVTVDRLRADRVSEGGARGSTTRNLDRLAARGLHALRLFAPAPNSELALRGLLTGRDAVELAAGGSPTTLAQELQRAGVTTSAVVGGDLAFPADGYERLSRRGTEATLEAALAELEALADVRFFLHLHLDDLTPPRAPEESELETWVGEEPEDWGATGGYEAYARRLQAGEGRNALGEARPAGVVPPEHARWISGSYDAGVVAVDERLRPLLARLETLGLEPNTLVCVVGVVGEGLLEHGVLGAQDGLWHELLQVPLWLAGPDIPANLELSGTMALRHLGPSLERALGLGGALQEGEDLFAAAEASPPVLTHTPRGRWRELQGVELFGLRTEVFSLIHARGGALGPDGEWRYFAVEGDPGEGADLSAQAPYEERAQAAMDELRARIEASRRHAAENRP